MLSATCKSYDLPVQQYVCRRTGARHAPAESLPDVLSMDDAGAGAVRAKAASAVAVAAKSSSPSLVRVPKESVSHLLRQLLGIVNK